MSRTVSTLLLDLAAWIAPTHRRPWIAGLRAEAAIVDHPTLWAWGALTTALGQRLADTVASGLIVRLVLGGFVISVATGFAALLMEQMPSLEAAAARAHQNLALILPIFATILLVLATGGMAIAFSAGRPWFNRYGRTLFALFSLFTGQEMVRALTHQSNRWHPVTAYGHLQNVLSTIVGALLIAAAPALLFRWGRPFLVLAAGALSIEIIQWSLELPLSLPNRPAPLIAFFNCCMPTLLMLSAFGLLLQRRSPATA